MVYAPCPHHAHVSRYNTRSAPQGGWFEGRRTFSKPSRCHEGRPEGQVCKYHPTAGRGTLNTSVGGSLSCPQLAAAALPIRCVSNRCAWFRASCRQTAGRFHWELGKLICIHSYTRHGVRA